VFISSNFLNMDFQDIVSLFYMQDISNSTMALLPTPKREKCSNRGGNERLDYGASAMQGWRPNMEDAVSNLLTFCRIFDHIGL
jgi:hypothetical protein